MVTKKIKGIKRHIAVDCFGILIQVIVDKANEHDSQKLIKLVSKIRKQKPNLLETVLADSAYRGFADELFELHGVILDIKPNLKTSFFEVQDIRWIVERSFAWMKGFRRLAKDYEKSPASSEAQVKITFIQITLQKITNFYQKNNL
jgi:putative transposase